MSWLDCCCIVQLSQCHCGREGGTPFNFGLLEEKFSCQEILMFENFLQKIQNLGLKSSHVVEIQGQN